MQDKATLKRSLCAVFFGAAHLVSSQVLNDLPQCAVSSIHLTILIPKCQRPSKRSHEIKRTNSKSHSSVLSQAAPAIRQITAVFARTLRCKAPSRKPLRAAALEMIRRVGISSYQPHNRSSKAFSSSYSLP